MTTTAARALVIRPGEPITDTTRDLRWLPVQVTAHLSEPLVGTSIDQHHLDGPLSYGAYVRARDAGVVMPPLTDDACIDFRLPLATWTAPAPPGTNPGCLTPDGAVWGWACSRGWPELVGTGRVQVRKAAPVREVTRYTADRRYHVGLGAHKARDTTHSAVHVPRIHWSALGSPDGISDLLEKVRGLGQMVQRGHGHVDHWTVTVNTDRDAWHDRVIPGYGGPVAGIRAPYWHRTRQCPTQALTC